MLAGQKRVMIQLCSINHFLCWAVHGLFGGKCIVGEHGKWCESICGWCVCFLPSTTSWCPWITLSLAGDLLRWLVDTFAVGVDGRVARRQRAGACRHHSRVHHTRNGVHQASGCGGSSNRFEAMGASGQRPARKCVVCTAATTLEVNPLLSSGEQKSPRDQNARNTSQRVRARRERKNTPSNSDSNITLYVKIHYFYTLVHFSHFLNSYKKCALNERKWLCVEATLGTHERKPYRPELKHWR